MNILVIIPKTFAGCGFYRLYQPHNHLAKNYDVKITFGSGFMKSEISAYTDDELREFDMIVWHKTLFELSDIRRARKLGVPTIADFDDHWVVNREHSLYKEYTKIGLSAKLHKLLISVDYVTCTTEDLADEIFKYNENVEVLPNAVDKGYDGWKEGRVKEDNFVFGYLGGPCHTRDVALLRGVQEATHANFRLFGYNGTDIYKFYDSILKGERFKGADIWNYPKFYNYMDCSLVPLEDNFFNSMKSELKLIEAGAFKKCVIVSNVKPYTNVIRHGENCLAAETKSDWINFIKTIQKNPNIAEDLGSQLAEDTKEYDINIVNKKRYNFYSDVQQKHNTNNSRELSGMVNVE
jgi:glycosyltransferase involved in cell wall biosynthesis